LQEQSALVDRPYSTQRTVILQHRHCSLVKPSKLSDITYHHVAISTNR
jgi:hypothetical protein